jgi:hypothetical protein
MRCRAVQLLREELLGDGVGRALRRVVGVHVRAGVRGREERRERGARRREADLDEVRPRDVTYGEVMHVAVDEPRIDAGVIAVLVHGRAVVVGGRRVVPSARPEELLHAGAVA